KALSIWVNQVIVSELSVSEALISEKAHYFATIMGISEENMKFSNGWLNGFKQKNNLKVHKIHGEANDTPLELLPNMRAELKTLIAKYRPEDIFNTDETGLFFRIESNQTLSSGPVTRKKR
ncbi:36106_t:CDS:1, partial [Racocetra persica]